MVSSSKNDDDYQFARTKATWKANFAQIGGFCILAAILNSKWPP
jgi:hypothetical protein